MRKRIVSFVLTLTLLLPSFSAGAAGEQKELVYLPVADSYASLAQPDTNYGVDANAKIAVYSTTARNIPYYSFSFAEERHDDPKINADTLKNNGLWYSFDVTKSVKEAYTGDRELNVALWIPWEANTDYSGIFMTREAASNLPHLKIKINSSGDVTEAKIYLFGGTISPQIEIYETEGIFDELKMTYNKRPQLQTLFGRDKVEYEMSGEPKDEAVVNTYEGMDIAGISKTKMTDFHTQYPDFPSWDEIYNTKLVPSVEQLAQDYEKNLPDKSHPRIFGNSADWDSVMTLIDSNNEQILKWKEQVISTAETAINRGAPVYRIRATGDIDNCGADIPNLGLAYRVTKDKRYSDACFLYMKAVAEYTNWNAGGTAPLNMGACSRNVGLGYDLIYDAMTDEQKNEIVKGAVKNCFNVMQGSPNTGTNNWNPVINGGIAILACAMADEEPEIAFEIVRQSVANIPISLAEYYPDGGFPEGPSYWAYMLDYFAEFLAAIDYTFGNDYGLGDFKGISATGFYPVYLQGPDKSIRFKYGDDRTPNIASKALFFLARRFDNPVFARYQLECAKSLNNYMTIAPYWYHEDSVFGDGGTSVYEGLPKDRVFDGQSPVGTMRSSWDDENALFTGFKAGFAQTSHADLDIGTFSFAANGVEWGCELKGSSDYVHPGYYSLFRMSRYLYYERSVQGHNTLLFNPGRSYPNIEFGQEPNSYSTIEKSDFTEGKAPYVILDISDAYRRYAASVRRGISLINNRREFLIQDEIRSSGSNTVYWFMHTLADIEVNGREAILTQGDKRLYCKILSPGDASFEVMDAKPLPMTATAGGYDIKNNRDYKKLSVKCNYKGSTTLSIWMVPLVYGDKIPTEEPKVKKLDMWPIEETENVKLDSIKINGETIDGFKPEKYVYNYETQDDNFDYEVSADENTEVKTEYGSGYLRIECIDKTGVKKPSRYLVAAVRKAVRQTYKFEASEVPQPENGPGMTLDGDLETRYASEGNQWIVYDLDSKRTLDHVMLAFYRGDSRRYNMGIELSEDGENFKNVYSGKTSGTSAELEKYSFQKQKARYVKITFAGNNENNWNNLSEIAFGFADDDLSDYIEQEYTNGD